MNVLLIKTKYLDKTLYDWIPGPIGSDQSKKYDIVIRYNKNIYRIWWRG